MDKITVVGAGTMGSGIGYVTATAGYQTVLYDPYPEMLAKARAYHKKLIDRAVEIYHRTSGPAVVSVTGISDHVFNGRLEGTRFRPNYDIHDRPLSQDYAPLYRENGAIYVTQTQALLAHHNRLAEPLHAVVMSEIESIDIDSEADFALAEQIMNALGMSAHRAEEVVPSWKLSRLQVGVSDQASPVTSLPKSG